MNGVRLLIVPLLAIILLSMTASPYYVPVVTAQRSAHSKKPTQFHFVCPMHENVTSNKPGKCHKCKMKLEKKSIKQPEDKPPDQ